MNRRSFSKKLAMLSGVVIVPRFVLGKGYTAPSDLIGLGFIGNGRQAQGLKTSFLKTDKVKVVAASEVYSEKSKAFVEGVNKFYAEKADQQKYDAVRVFSDFRELLAQPDIDAVVIATPDHWHGVHAVKAAEAGKDIYCEKPLSLTVKEGRAMVEATRRNKRVFQTGSMQRSWPEFRQTAELIRNGYIGDIQTIKVSVGGPPVPYDLPPQPVPGGLDWEMWLGPNSFAEYNSDLAPPLTADFWAKWRNYKEFGGGGMTDWGAHMFDIVQWSLDKDNSGPVEVIPPDGKNTQFLTYRYDNGITMTHENFGITNAIRFIGSKGTIDVQRRKLETSDPLLKDRVIGDNEKKVYFSDNHYLDFLDAIKTRKNPICDVEIGHRTATVCNIGNIAYELKRPLQWDPEKEKFKKDSEANAKLSRPLRKEWKIKV
jgi:predicted dehydrogenase